MITGFDKFLNEKGFELVTGEMRDLNTYNNTWRSWFKDGRYISIGLYAQPTRIGVESSNGVFNLPIPTENDYERYLEILTK